MFIVTDKDGNVKKYRSLRNKHLSNVSIDCTKDSDIEEAILDNCVIQSQFCVMFKRSHLRNCKVSDTTISMVESVSHNTNFNNTLFKYVSLSSITDSVINDSELREVRVHFIRVNFIRISLEGMYHDMALNHCKGMVSTSGLGHDRRTAYCYNSPVGPMAAIGCFRGTRLQAAFAISVKYGASSDGKLYSSAVEMLFDLLEAQ